MANTDIFERMAAVYDNEERINIGKMAADEIRKLLPDIKNMTALDFGCGTGIVGIDLIDEFDKVTFLDSSANMIEVVNEKLKFRNTEDFETICLDMERGDKLNLSVDCIFMVQVLLHIPDTKDILLKLKKIIKDGGHLIIIDFDKNDSVVSDLVHNGFDRDSLKSMMEEIGYRDLKSKVFHSGEKIFMGKDADMFILDSIV